MTAPCNSVMTAMMAAVAKKSAITISAPTAKRMMSR